jgi:lactate dehydrogenase-like 2-hydroxyacid dehydrogenase
LERISRGRDFSITITHEEGRDAPMNEKIVLFTEEDTQFRLMETALNGKPSPNAIKALHYFFGEDIDAQLNYLLSLPSVVGLPPAFRGIVCDDEKELPSLVPKADYLVFERTEIDGKGKLKFIQKFGSDYRNIDLNAAKDLGMTVAYLSRVTTISVSEHVLALILTLSRNLMFAHETAKNRIHVTDGLRSEGPPRTKFNWGEVPNIKLVRGKTLGLVGFGENAHEIAKLAHGVGMKIVYYQRHKAAIEWEKAVDAEYRPTLQQLVREADFISINVPYGPPTEKMFNSEILSHMKPSAFLISNSRGGIVDEEALYKVLKEKKIAGAALDVYRWEPVPSDCPLLKLDNIVWATHNGGGSNEFILQENHDVLANISRVARGDKPEFLIRL